MELDFADIIGYVGAAATIAVMVFAFQKLRGFKTLRWPALAAIFGLTGYHNLQLLFHEPELLTPFGVFDAWFRHAVFYLGQLYFFIFINRVIFLNSGDQRTPERRERMALAVFAFLLGLQALHPHQAHAMGNVSMLAGEMTPYHILLYLTDQGVQHIIAMIFFAISIAVLRSESLYAELRPDFTDRRTVIAPFLAANITFILLHLWEFLFESRHLFPMLSDATGELVERVFFFIGLGLFVVGLQRLSRNLGLRKTT